MPGWPWVPGLFMLFVVASTLFTVVQRPFEGLVGLLTLGAGIAFYFMHRRRKPAQQATLGPSGQPPAA